MVNFLKRYGGYLAAFAVIGFWIWRFSTGRENSKTWDTHKNVPEKVVINPRESVKTDTLYFHDSTFIRSTKIDTVYKTPAN